MAAGVDQHLAGAEQCRRHGGAVSGRAVEALQTVLVLEHAAVQLYGLLGGETSQTADPARHGLVTAGFAVHRERRDDVVAALRGATPYPCRAAPVYSWPPTGTPEQAAAAALDLERRCTGSLRPPRRRQRDGAAGLGVAALGESALAELRAGAGSRHRSRGPTSSESAARDGARAGWRPARMPNGPRSPLLGEVPRSSPRSRALGPWWTGQQQSRGVQPGSRITSLTECAQAGDLGNDFWPAGSCSA